MAGALEQTMVSMSQCVCVFVARVFLFSNQLLSHVEEDRALLEFVQISRQELKETAQQLSANMSLKEKFELATTRMKTIEGIFTRLEPTLKLECLNTAAQLSYELTRLNILHQALA